MLGLVCDNLIDHMTCHMTLIILYYIGGATPHLPMVSFDVRTFSSLTVNLCILFIASKLGLQMAGVKLMLNRVADT